MLPEREGLSPTEIEITPAMIEAGLHHLLTFSREADIYEWKVRDLYLDMERARLGTIGGR